VIALTAVSGMADSRFGFLGAGRMATALAQGLAAAGLAKAAALIASDPLPPAREAFAATTGGAACASNAEVVSKSDVVVLAVKPQHMAQALADVRDAITDRHLVVSIAAGTKLASIAMGLPHGRLVRVMPNTPCLVGQGASAYCLGRGATSEDGKLVERLLSAVGKSVAVDEKLLDAVTGLSGSGPAYAFVMIEALSDGGVRMGLPRNVATLLAAQTLRGAAEMLLTSGEHPGVLKDQVASPGGTTIAGLQALETGGIRAALMAAVEAATLRSAELGGG
jgi:pyrroline-5-carboxylate reductase